MSKKDLIIIGIAVNVCVLVLLFVSSLRPTALPKSEPAPALVQEIAAAPEPDKREVETAVTEVDQVIEAVTAAAAGNESTGDLLDPYIAGDLTEVTVKSGDVLGKFAHEYNVSIDEIMRLNHLTSTSLQIGQVIYLPRKKEAIEAVPVSDLGQTNLTLSDERYYTVKNGDSPWTVAMKNHIKLEELLRLNNLDEKKAKKLKPGDRLRIR